MKHILLSAILGASLLTPSASSASSCNGGTLRMVVSLDGTTDKLIGAYRESLRGKRVGCDERSLFDAIYAFDRSTDALRCSMERGEEPCMLERIFAGVSRDLCTMKALSTRVHICGCTRELIACSDAAVAAIRRSGFAYARPDYDYGHRGHDRDRRLTEYRPSNNQRVHAPDPRELLINGIVGLLRNR